MKTEIQKNENETGAKVTVARPEKSSRVQRVPEGVINETDNGYTLSVALPGMEERLVEIGVKARTLAIEAERAETRHEGYQLVREESPAARYRAVYELPERVDSAHIKASLRNGILSVTLPKREEAKPRRIAIDAA